MRNVLTLDDGHFLYSTNKNNWLNIPAGGIRTAPFSPLPTTTRNTGVEKAEPTSTDFDGGGGLTDPAALGDLNRLQQTAPGFQLILGNAGNVAGRECKPRNTLD